MLIGQMYFRITTKTWASFSSHVNLDVEPRNLKGESCLLWTLCQHFRVAAILMVTYGGELYIVPLDLAWSFGAICAAQIIVAAHFTAMT